LVDPRFLDLGISGGEFSASWPGRFVLQESTPGTFLRSMHRLLVTANVLSSSPILVSLMMEALRSSDTSVLIKNHTA
jgi:hypothetical protein